MTKLLNLILVLVFAVALTGCTMGSAVVRSVFNTKAGPAPVPAQNQVQVGNNLALPPDLQLAAPTNTTDGYQPNIGTGEGAANNLALAKANEPAPAIPAIPSVYEEYGISLYDEKGVLKTPARLLKELKAAKLARKKAANPNYGTIKNIRNIFSDQ